MNRISPIGPGTVGLLIGLLGLLVNPGWAGEKNNSVVVIGAGLAGLNSALMLEEQGFSVTVLEARERIGGRLYTLDSLPGKPEAGGNVIGPSYARVIDRARKHGVTLVPAPQIAGGRSNNVYHIDGEFISLQDWAGAPQNPFPAKLKKLPPGSALFGVLRPNPLKKPDDWRLSQFGEFDVSVQPLLQKLGFDARGQFLAGHTNSYGNSLEDTSLLAMYRITSVYARGQALPGAPMSVEGGNQRLPEAMATAVKGDIFTGKRVTQIQQSDLGVKVRSKDGSLYHGDYVLVTAPVPALRNIDIEPVLPALWQKMLKEMEYAQTLLAFFSVSGQYWGAHTPSVWSDTRAERLFASADENGVVTNVIMWTTGSEAMAFGEMEHKDRNAALYRAFYDIYPDAQGKVHLEAVQDWGNDPLSGGSWLRWQPGQISEFAGLISKPVGRLFFAGEHTAVANTGMEAALESSERAVSEIIAASDRISGQALFVHCQACHSFEAGAAHKLGPNLHGFFGQSRASRAGYQYSDALMSAGAKWDRESLRLWLQDPQQSVPGNRMIYNNALSSEELDSLLDYLVTEGQ